MHEYDLSNQFHAADFAFARCSKFLGGPPFLLCIFLAEKAAFGNISQSSTQGRIWTFSSFALMWCTTSSVI